MPMTIARRGGPHIWSSSGSAPAATGVRLTKPLGGAVGVQATATVALEPSGATHTQSVTATVLINGVAQTPVTLAANTPGASATVAFTPPTLGGYWYELTINRAIDVIVDAPVFVAR